MKRLGHTARRVAQEAAGILNADVLVFFDEQVLAASDDAPAPPLALPVATVAWNDDAGKIEVGVYPREHDVSPGLAQAVVTLLIERDTMLESLATSDDVKDRFLRDLLLEDTVDAAEAQRLSRLLGLNLGRPRSVLLVDASAYILDAAEANFSFGETTVANPKKAREVIAAIAWFFSLPDETICVHLHGGLIAILKACATADLLQWSESDGDSGSASWANLGALKRAASEMQKRLQQQFRARIDIAVGRYHPGLGGLHASYEDCRLALKLGRIHRPGSMHSLDELGLSALIAATDEGTKRSLAARLIGPLSQDSDILPTLRAFFASNCSSHITADHLAIHRNTLSYRLDKVATLTGLDPRRFNDAIQLRISLELASITVPTSGLEGAAIC